MKDKQAVFLIIVLLVAYFWWKRKSPATAGTLNLSTGRAKGRNLSPSTAGSSASTTPRMTRQTIGLTNAQAGNGTGFVSAPQRAIAGLQSVVRRNIGTAVTARTLSRAWSGAGTAGISPTWPTRAVRANGTSIRTGSGFVQVPSYTAVPTVTRGPGGSGSVIFLGGK